MKMFESFSMLGMRSTELRSKGQTLRKCSRSFYKTTLHIKVSEVHQLTTLKVSQKNRERASMKKPTQQAKNGRNLLTLSQKLHISIKKAIFFDVRPFLEQLQYGLKLRKLCWHTRPAASLWPYLFLPLFPSLSSPIHSPTHFGAHTFPQCTHIYSSTMTDDRYCTMLVTRNHRKDNLVKILNESAAYKKGETNANGS
jgi:hypothetical protein